jgi:uncharacterized protein (DUF2126 family)
MLWSGHIVPVKPTANREVGVAGASASRAGLPASGMHPAPAVSAPLTFDVDDRVAVAQRDQLEPDKLGELSEGHRRDYGPGRVV